MRLRTAARTCIFTRSLTWVGHWRCRKGRCLKSCLARFFCGPSCKPVPWRSLQTSHQISTSLLCVWNSCHCPCGVYTPVSAAKRCFQLEPQAANLTFHCDLCSSNCTDALTAGSWCCLNFELDASALALSAILSANNFNAGSGSTIRTAFAYSRYTHFHQTLLTVLHTLDSELPREPSQGSWPTLDTKLMSLLGVLEKMTEIPSQTLGLSHFPLVAANAVLHDLSP